MSVSGPRVSNSKKGKRKTKADPRVANLKRGRNSTKEEEEEEEEEKEDRDLKYPEIPDWQNLPSDLLQSISDRISSSIPDLLSFSAACTSWRSLARSSLNATISGPPLLLSPLTDDPSSTCHLRNAILNYGDPQTFRLPISKVALNHRECRGFSHGHLIFGSSTFVLIADLFSPDVYRLPKPPRPVSRSPVFSHAVLTGPPSSSSSVLFLVCSPEVYCWRFGSDNKYWMDLYLGNYCSVRSVTMFNGMLHVLHRDCEVYALNFAHRRGVRWKRLPKAPFLISFAAYTRLVECDGELLLLSFIWTKKDWNKSIIIYKMDLEGGAWVRVESIGDWCLFMDFLGRCPMACRQPGKWGGQSNCIYFAGPQFDRWTVLPLDGTEFDHELDLVHGNFGQWPSPAWVYPRILL